MKMNTLGRTGISVSRICLGTMTFGRQNTEADGHAQMDMAVDHGVNFLDAAEVYPFLSMPETYGRTEEIIGTWMKARANRDKIVLATKIAGPSPRFGYIRDGALKFNKEHFIEAVDGSLKRLQTDYIDLYQTHWPERAANYFGTLGYSDDTGTDWTPFEEMLDAMAEIEKAGKVRAFGCSNETAWGVAEMLALSEAHGLPRMASVQNPYSLLNRSFEVGLAEVAIRGDCGLLAYSPLGFGALTGKYLDGVPDGSRRALYPDMNRNFKPRGVEATGRYVALARAHGLEPSQMALAFVNARAFLTSTIIGATDLDQLASNLASEEITLPSEVLDGIEEIHNDIPNPAP
ncbi:MAG: aldo/keto reductase [Magnetovibrio sp.]|nr:aldo/keto reductase [Magnetovibrio sp.]